MSEPPRSLPPTTLERLGVITSRLAAGSAGGMTRHARRTSSHATTSTAASSSAIQGSVYYSDPAIVSAGDYQFNPTDLVDSQGDTSVFAYRAGSPAGVQLNASGWYQASAKTGAYTDTEASLVLNVPSSFGGFDFGDWSVPVPAGGPFILRNVTSPPFYLPESSVGAAVSAQLYNIVGHNISICGIYVVKFVGD